MWVERGMAECTSDSLGSCSRSVNFARNKWDVSLESLSGGEARRLQLLQILAERPSILLMDEPTNDLDAVTVDAVEQLLQAMLLWQAALALPLPC